ncbi:MAG: hypothetical protein AAGF31_07430 [Planctomycetota bacterium]
MKSETKLAGKDALQASAQTRYAEKEVPGFGRIRMRSISTSAYARIEGMLSRAAVALSDPNREDGVRMLVDAKIAFIAETLVDENNEKWLNGEESQQLRNLDSAVFSAIEDACNRHCGIQGIDVEARAKNSSETTGDDSR